jgi:hypothetical protein
MMTGRPIRNATQRTCEDGAVGRGYRAYRAIVSDCSAFLQVMWVGADVGLFSIIIPKPHALVPTHS